jgi:hypothetical protein
VPWLGVAEVSFVRLFDSLKHHLKGLFAKLGVRDRTEAAQGPCEAGSCTRGDERPWGSA